MDGNRLIVKKLRVLDERQQKLLQKSIELDPFGVSLETYVERASNDDSLILEFEEPFHLLMICEIIEGSERALFINHIAGRGLADNQGLLAEFLFSLARENKCVRILASTSRSDADQRLGSVGFKPIHTLFERRL